ncbi:MAG: tetratricopeptide repeat protein [Burkholderiales bacterium]|nr:tetratricopeptide repeat protein [Opitutaceae bacterium]
MNRICFVVTCAAALLLAGCSKKEVDPAVEAEAKMLISESQFAMQIREFKRAEELVQRAIELRDDQPEYWVSLGMARRRQDNTAGARKAYEKALSMHTARYKDEKKPEELAQQTFVLALLGRTDEALKLLEKGVKDHPDSAALKKMADPRGLPRTFQTADFKALAI